MVKKRFKVTQNGDLFTVKDTNKNESMGVFEFKENEFPVYVCFMKIIDKMNELNDKNEQLKTQLYCDYDEGVCRICKHYYLEKRNLFYISKCEKGHEECSKNALKHCKDFEIKECKND